MLRNKAQNGPYQEKSNCSPFSAVAQSLCGSLWPGYLPIISSDSTPVQYAVQCSDPEVPRPGFVDFFYAERLWVSLDIPLNFSLLVYKVGVIRFPSSVLLEERHQIISAQCPTWSKYSCP